MRNKNTGRLSQCLLASAVALLGASCGGGGGGGTTTGTASASGGATGGSNIAITKDCVAGVTQGFAGNIETSLAGTGGSDGGGGGGDGGASGAGGGVGKVLGGLMRVTDLSDGTVVGEAVTDSSQGLVTVKTCSRAGPFLLTLEGQSGAKYFDEGVNQMLDFGAGNVLHALVDQWNEHVGVSPFTEAAYRYALNNYKADPVAIVAGTAPLRVTGSLTGLTAVQVRSANAFILNSINTQNITPFSMVSVKSLPTPIDQNSSSTAVSTSRYGTSAIVNGGVARAAAFFNPSLGTPALKYANAIATDLTDGRLDGFGLDRNPVASAANSVYHPTNFPLWAAAGNGSMANNFAANKFAKSGVVDVAYKLEYLDAAPIDSGNWPNIRAQDTAILKDDGNVTLTRVRNGQTTIINNFATDVKHIFYTRSSRLDELKGVEDTVSLILEQTPQKAYILKKDGTVWTWGSNISCVGAGIWGDISVFKNNEFKLNAFKAAWYPKITNSTNDYNDFPVQLTSLKNITDISVGPYSDNVLARTANGEVFQWGRDVTGFLFRDTDLSKNLNRSNHWIMKNIKISENQTINQNDSFQPILDTGFSVLPTCIAKPQKVLNGDNATYIVAAANANLFLRADGKVYSWGRGGELGLNKKEPYLYADDAAQTLSETILPPTVVTGIEKIGSISATGSRYNSGARIYAIGLGKNIKEYESFYEKPWYVYTWAWGAGTPSDFYSGSNSAALNLPLDLIPKSTGVIANQDKYFFAGLWLNEDGRIRISGYDKNNWYASYLNINKIRYMKQIGQDVWMFGVDEKIYHLDPSTALPVDITQVVQSGLISNSPSNRNISVRSVKAN